MADPDPPARKRGIPLPAVILATVAAALAAALVFGLLEDDEAESADAPVVELQPGEPEGGFATGQDLSGTTAPAVTFEALDLDGTDAGDDVDLDAYRDGRPMVLNFFGSWCAPCVREMPDLESVSQALDGEVVFLGLAERDRAEDALDIVESTGVTYDIGRDPDGSVLTAFEGLAMPTTVFLRADGTITSVHSGALTEEDLMTKIEAELR